MIQFSRQWAMPSADTFDIPPIREFVKKYLRQSKVSIDPFARNKRWATYTNDLNPDTAAEYHMDAEAFCKMLADKGVTADLILFDPPYSPTQIKEVYDGIGLKSIDGCSNSAMYARVRKSLIPVLSNGGFVLSFGWSSSGMGLQNLFKIEEIMIVPHGGAHNDTICMAERKIAHQAELMLDTMAAL